MPAAGVIGAVGTIGSAIIGSSAASKAAKMQADAANSAAAMQWKMYRQMRSDLSPYADVGKGAMGTLASLYGLKGAQPYSPDAIDAFKRAPDYQVTYQNGVNGITSADAASRSLLSGAHMKNLVSFAGNLADSRFNNYLSRLYSLAGMGQSAAAGQGAGAMTTGENIGRLQMDAASAAGSGLVGQSNIWTSAIGDLSRNLGYLASKSSSYSHSPSLY